MSAMLSCSVDWITASKKYAFAELDVVTNILDAQWIALRVKQELGLDNGGLTFARREGFYAWVFVLDEYKVEVGVSETPSKQGIVVRCTGKSFQNGVDADSILAIMRDKAWRVTRLDIAFDMVGEAELWEMVYVKAKAFCDKKNRKVQEIVAKTGHTIYIGSRESERMVRIYDKGAQQKVDYLWTRLEMEYKGDVAAQMARISHPVAVHALADVVAWLDGSDIQIVHAATDYTKAIAAPDIVRIPVRSDREVWMNSTVSAALLKWALEDFDRAQQWLSNMSSMLDIMAE